MTVGVRTSTSFGREVIGSRTWTSSGWAETSARALHARSERLRRRSLELRAPEWTLVKRCLRRGVRLAQPDDSTAFCARRRARY
jgi:hypothetical protein